MLVLLLCTAAELLEQKRVHTLQLDAACSCMNRALTHCPWIQIQEDSCQRLSLALIDSNAAVS
jgi:hypothetical protein